ncbi:MAG: DUF600 family protein [Clostridia bacterium]|nr:DUF600 family protein [Clostridia bacterium]
MSQIRENKAQFQHLLQRLAQIVVDVAPRDWTCAVIGYFLEGENEITHQQIHIWSMQADDYIDIMEAAWDCEEYDEAILEMGDLCAELRKCCASAGDRWTGMTFCLRRNGEFRADYSYDPIDAYNAWFIRDWQSRYLI